jgi:hypothetical protein
MKEKSSTSSGWKRWLGIALMVIALAGLGYLLRDPAQVVAAAKKGTEAELGRMVGMFAVPIILLFAGLSLLLKSRSATKPGEEVPAMPAPEGTLTTPVLPAKAKAKGKVALTSCNVLYAGADRREVWHFDANRNFTLSRGLAAAGDEELPAALVQKTWGSLWQPKLNIAWLPADSVFLRVVHLPQGSFEETVAMLEFQLEKLSPIPITQMVWSAHPMPQSAEGLQTLMVVFAERKAVEEFLGKLEGQGFLADRLELSVLDQLQATLVSEDGAWIYPTACGGHHTALVAWWYGGVLRNLNFVTLPATGDRVAGLKEQLAQMVWAGELDGWLTAPPAWHLVADESNTKEWETSLRQAVDAPMSISTPLAPAQLAALTARRAAAADPKTSLLPTEFATRYRQQFVDRLWGRGLLGVGAVYLVGIAVFFAALQVQSFRASAVEKQVKGLGLQYTNTIQLRDRYKVLKERQELKFAALECWKAVAELMPASLGLETSSLVDGRTLRLNGTVPASQVTEVYDFYDAMRKVMVNEQPLFDVNQGSPPTTRTVQGGAVASWNFVLELKRAEVR